MYATYLRLGLHVSATPLQVIRAARKKLARRVRRNRIYRKDRHKFYRKMLEHHKSDQDLYRELKF